MPKSSSYGYINDLETGSVEAFGGKLNVRPPYQREFVWDQGSSNGGKKQKALSYYYIFHLTRDRYKIS